MKQCILLGGLLLVGCRSNHPDSSPTTGTEQRVYANVVLKARSGPSVLDTVVTVDRIEQPGVFLSVSSAKDQSSPASLHLPKATGT